MNRQANDIFEVENEGFVAAGRTVPFPAPDTTSFVSLSPAEADLAAKGLIRTVTMCGRSNEHIGLFDGDKLIVKKAFSRSEILPKTVCLVYMPNLGEEVLAKKIRFEGEWIKLRSSHNEFADIFVPSEEVEIRGIVIGMQRRPDSNGRFDRGYDDGIPY
jgi:hypothetical protein